MPLKLALLGGFDCRSVAGEPVLFATRKAKALLAYLATQSGGRARRERLAGLLWCDVAEDQARASLRKALSRLRQALPPAIREALRADAEGVAIEAGALALDVAMFDRLAADGTPATLEQAAALYRGPFLDGLDGCGAPFAEWAAAERRRLEEALQQVLRQLLDHHVVTGAIDPGIAVALRLLAIDPLQEGVHRTLIRLYLYQDRLGAALAQYRDCRDLLARELGAAPAPETEQLMAELLRLAPSDLATPERDAVPPVLARPRPVPAGRGPAVVVLPFALAAAAEPADHLAVGMAEDVATELGRFRELQVIAPASALAYRGVAPAQAGAELGADYVVHGNLRVRAGGARITVRLIDSRTAGQLWAEHYDCAGDALLEVQDEMVRGIVGALVGEIAEAALAAARRRRPADWQVYELWLRGWSALRRPELGAIQEARRWFQQAIARDPGFARAYVGLAFAHLNEWACFSWNHWAFLPQTARQLAEQAVALDDREHRAHCMLGVARLYARDYEAAQRELATALALNPNDADVLAHAAFARAMIGDHEAAVEAGRRALRLAPHRPEWHAAMVGVALFSARLYDEALATLASAPQAFCDTPAFIAAAHACLGRPDAGQRYRETVDRHYRLQLGRGAFPASHSCIDWLSDLSPFRRPADRDHFVAALRLAGFA